MANTATSRALLVSLNLPKWEARKLDRKVGAEVAAQHRTDASAGNYSKNLLLKGQNSYADLISHIGSVRVLHYSNTLPWADDGWRVLPVANYMAYTAHMRRGRSDWETKLEAFLADYPALQAAAKAERNGLLRDEEYPSAAKLRKRFDFDLSFRPLPSGGDFRVELAADEIARIAASTEERVKAALDSAQRDGIARLYDCVQKLHERLADPKAIFRDTLITNARDLCDALERLNLADDPRLEDFRQQTAALASADPQELRDNDAMRTFVANESDRIMQSMAGFYGPLTGEING